MRGALRFAAVGALATALTLTAALPASAHSVLVGSTPSEGEVLAELPAQFSVTLNERLMADAGLAAFALRVHDASGLYYGDGCLTITGETLSTPAALGPAGDYVLEWQVVSADGHPVGGELAFSWTGEATAAGSATPPSCGAEPGEVTAPADPGHHGAEPSQIPLGDVMWIVGAVLVVAIAVALALIATRRRPNA